MTYGEALREFRETVLPAVVARYGDRDTPAKGLAWSEFIDALHRDKRITDAQAHEWCPPDSALRTRPQ